MKYLGNGSRKKAGIVASLGAVLVAGGAPPSAMPTSLQASPEGDVLNLELDDPLEILFVWLTFSDDQGMPAAPVVSFNQIATLRPLVEQDLEKQAYGKHDVQIAISADRSALASGGEVMPHVLPHSASYYQSLMPADTIAIRLRADVEATLAAYAQANPGAPDAYLLDQFDREVLFAEDVWLGNGAKGGLNYRTVLQPHTIRQSLTHELGHTFGFRHADSLVNTNLDPWMLPPLSEPNYGDWYDPMGIGGRTTKCSPAGEFHHFHPWYKRRVGWLDDSDILTIAPPSITTYVALQPYELDPDEEGWSAVRIRRDYYTDYWIFWQTQEPEIASHAATVTIAGYTTTHGSVLLDLDTSTTNILPNCGMDQGALDGELYPVPLPGSSFDDVGAGVSVTNLGEWPGIGTPTNQLLLRVDLTETEPEDRVPVIDVVAPARGVTVTGLDTYTVTAFDPDAGTTPGAGIASVKFYLFNKNDDNCVAGLSFYPPQIPMISSCFLDGLAIEGPEVTGSLPSYSWTPQATQSMPQGIPTGDWYLVVRAVPTGGAVGDNDNIVLFEYWVDNDAE